MKKKYLLVLSTILLAPAVLSVQVSADEQVASSEVSDTSIVTVAAQSAESSNETNSVTETASVETSTTSTEKDAVILHTNDVHGRIVEERGVIGDAKLATVIAEERAKENQTTLVVDAGDAFQGLPISNSSKGEARAEILNKMGYDAMAVGNHEFDFGLDEAKKYKEILNFPLLSSNTYVDGVRLFEASTIVDKDQSVEGDEFVVIGVTTPETGTKTHPKNIVGVTFTEPIAEVNKVIDEIESKALAENKNYKNYIILAHLGVDSTTPVEWRGSTLAEALSNNSRLTGKRVVVIDGHSHTVASTTYGKNVTYNQTGSYLQNVGKVTLKSGELLGNPTLISADEAKKLTPNPEIETLVTSIKAKYDAENAVVVVANNPVELNGKRENVRVRETNLGNVVADALYEYGQAGFAHKTDLAVTNGGGLRETIAKNQAITKGNIIAVLPFGNTISQIQVIGQNIKDMFEKSLGSILQVDQERKTVVDENGQPLLEPSGGFLQVSGAKVYYDTNLESGQRVLAIYIKNHTNGQYDKLDLTKTYYLATNDFLAAGGDGYTMLGGSREEGPSMDVAFEEYLKVADLSQYSVVNPNSRTISVDSKTLVLPSDEDKGQSPLPVDKDKKQEVNDNKNLDIKKETPSSTKEDTSSKRMTDVSSSQKVPVSYGKTYSEKANNQTSLPKTGDTGSVILSLVGLILSTLGIAGIRKKW
ncbi:5'-nucleotidase [Streptococcus sp. DD10]|nr:5'-nucleotidase [Streptococcus sp. DD10]